jgi:RNA recognition motif-containing protein
MKIKVSNLDPFTSEQDLFDLFEEFGEVISVRRRARPDSGGDTYTALVHMAQEDAAQAALSELDGERMDGRSLRLSPAGEGDLSQLRQDAEPGDEEPAPPGKVFERIQRRRPEANPRDKKPKSGKRGRL